MRSWPVPQRRAALPAPGPIWPMARGVWATPANVPLSQIPALRAQALGHPVPEPAQAPASSPVSAPLSDGSHLDELDIDWACENLEVLLDESPLQESPLRESPLLGASPLPAADSIERAWDVRVVLSPRLREALAASRAGRVDDIEERVLAQEGVLAAALGEADNSTDGVPHELILRLSDSAHTAGASLVAKALRESLAQRP